MQDLPVTRPYQHPDTYSSWHLYVIRLQRHRINRSHREVFEALRNAGIGVNVHYIPVHTQPYYQQLGFKQGDFPESECYYQEAISLPLYYDLTQDNQNYVIKTLGEILQ